MLERLSLSGVFKDILCKLFSRSFTEITNSGLTYKIECGSGAFKKKNLIILLKKKINEKKIHNLATSSSKPVILTSIVASSFAASLVSWVVTEKVFGAM